MINIEDLNTRKSILTTAQKINLEDLCLVVNELGRVTGLPMKVTNGFRSEMHHREIYLKKGIVNPPMGSAHLKGAACDLHDPDSLLKYWFFKDIETAQLTDRGEKFLKQHQCYLEHPKYSPQWLHLQLIAPKSQKLVFVP